MQMLQALNQKSNPKHKEKNPHKTPITKYPTAPKKHPNNKLFFKKKSRQTQK